MEDKPMIQKLSQAVYSTNEKTLFAIRIGLSMSTMHKIAISQQRIQDIELAQQSDKRLHANVEESADLARNSNVWRYRLQTGTQSSIFFTKMPPTAPEWV